MPFFSIVMQSTLADYPGAATGRGWKLCRAIHSITGQSFKDWELIIVSDSCNETSQIVMDLFPPDIRVKLIRSFEEPKGKWFSHCRNVGKDAANGQYILYLDNDDDYRSGYLQQLHDEIQKTRLDWYIVDHYEWDKSKWKRVSARMTPNSAGTANIVHSSKCGANWPTNCHYGSEDWTFIRTLMSENRKHAHLGIAGYNICHVRGRYDI